MGAPPRWDHCERAGSLTGGSLGMRYIRKKQNVVVAVGSLSRECSDVDKSPIHSVV